MPFSAGYYFLENNTPQEKITSEKFSPFVPHPGIMGTGFTIDTPLRIARYGISSVISLVEDILIEQMRKFYCDKHGMPYEEITNRSRVLFRLFLMLQSYKPLTFFGSIGILAVIASALSGFRPVLEYIEYEYVYRVPRAVLAAALAVISLLSVGISLILHSNNYRLREVEKVLVKRTAAVNDGSRTA